MFSSEFCKISKNTFFYRTPPVAASVNDLEGYVVKGAFRKIFSMLRNIFNLSINQSVFTEILKIALVTAIYKNRDKTLLTNWRATPLLPYFSKKHEHIMYNRIYNFPVDNESFYENQFGFQATHSTQDAIFQLVSHITDSLNDWKFTFWDC